MSDTVQIWLQDAKMTHSLGGSLSNTLYRLPVTLLVSGELGAGKTTFLQGLAENLGIDERITSPTYALEQRYRTKKGWEFLHIDLYRLTARQARELIEGSNGHAGVRCIEWAERIPGFEDEPVIRILLLEKEGKAGRYCSVSFEDILLPTREEIETWRHEVQLPEHIVRHCDAVAAYASELAETLLKKGVLLRPLALRRAAEAHDLLRFLDFRDGAGTYKPSEEERTTWEEWRERYPNMKHEPACAAFLRDKGYGELAEIVAVHGLSLPTPERATIEQQLLYYADKRVMIDKVVTLEERFADFRKRYSGGEKSKEGEIWYAEAKEVERKVFPQGIEGVSS